MSDRTVKISGPAWDNSAEYPSLDSPEIRTDLAEVEKLTESLRTLTAKLNSYDFETIPAEREDDVVNLVAECLQAREQVKTTVGNLSTYVNCIQSVDGANAEAKALGGQIAQAVSGVAAAFTPVVLFYQRAPDAIIAKLLAHPSVSGYEFVIRHARRARDRALSSAEEDIIIALGVHGPGAFGRLYDSLSGMLSFALETPSGTKEVGLAEAFGLSMSADEAVRRSAYEGTQQAWKSQQDTCAAVLNSLAGWRQEIYKRRSHSTPVHFLDEPIHQGCITRETLDVMMAAVKDFRPTVRRVLRLIARALKKERLDPWDLLAPTPSIAGTDSWKNLAFGDGLKLIVDAFSDVDPEMGQFAQMMADNNWIEGTVGAKKRPGAYCTKFIKSRTPRVYMTYTGSMQDIQTLAHELGHAFHSWVMRDLPLPELTYPMTLAETASIFAQTVVNDVMLKNAKTPAARFLCSWTSAREADLMLINVGLRYEFEYAFYQKRQLGPLSAEALSELMAETWQEWYGDTLSSYNGMFWASKLHFSLSRISFYNFPYIFGYLFALGVYAQREKQGTNFFTAYRELLRDTGRMTAEDLASKHLGVDLRRRDFWDNSLAIVKQDIQRFEQSVHEVF